MLQIHCRSVFPDHQILPAFHIFNYQALLVSQMQQADEAVRCADVLHLLLRVDVLQVIHDINELQRAGIVGLEGRDLRSCGRWGCWFLW